jgi:membrane protein
VQPPPFVIRWSDVLRRTGRAVYEDDCLGWAAELAFFWFLALFPASLFLVAVASYLPVEHLVDVAVSSLARVAPDDVLVLVREQLTQIAKGPPSGLLTLSLLGALWSSSSAMTAINDTLNQAYHVRETRSWWRVRLLAAGLTVVLVAFTLVAVAVVTMGPTLVAKLGDSLELPGAFTRLWSIAEWPLAFGLVATALGWVYYFAPDARRPWAWLTPGAVAATLLGTLASFGFRWYAGHFGEYQKTYGAIGGVIVALLWLYAAGLAILIGAELNAAIEQTASALPRDGGPPRVTSFRRRGARRPRPRAPRRPIPER